MSGHGGPSPNDCPICGDKIYFHIDGVCQACNTACFTIEQWKELHPNWVKATMKNEGVKVEQK